VLAGNTWLPHHCVATSRLSVRSLYFGSHSRWLSITTPGPEKSRSVPSGSSITVMSGSGSAPNMSEKITTWCATMFANSCTFAESARGAYTATLIPSACFGLNCRGPATNDPFGSRRSQ